MKNLIWLKKSILWKSFDPQKHGWQGLTIPCEVCRGEEILCLKKKERKKARQVENPKGKSRKKLERLVELKTRKNGSRKNQDQNGGK